MEKPCSKQLAGLETGARVTRPSVQILVCTWPAPQTLSCPQRVAEPSGALGPLLRPQVLPHGPRWPTAPPPILLPEKHLSAPGSGRAKPGVGTGPWCGWLWGPEQSIRPLLGHPGKELGRRPSVTHRFPSQNWGENSETLTHVAFLLCIHLASGGHTLCRDPKSPLEGSL